MISGIVTLILMIIFIAICFWAYSDKRQSAFREAEQLPLREDNNHE